MDITYKSFKSKQQFMMKMKKIYPDMDKSFHELYWVIMGIGKTRCLLYLNEIYDKNLEESNIFFSWLNVSYGAYIYDCQTDGLIHTILINQKYISKFEDKLYQLTHGPKALSIPDAFKVLVL